MKKFTQPKTIITKAFLGIEYAPGIVGMDIEITQNVLPPPPGPPRSPHITNKRNHFRL